MSATIEVFINGTQGQLQDIILNGFKDENNNLISSSGQALNVGDFTQTDKAISVYASKGDFYKEAGGSAADVYVLEKSDEQTEVFQLKDGMRIRFRVVNTNTGASTVNINSFGAKAIVFRGQSLSGGEMTSNETVTLIYNESSDNFDIRKFFTEISLTGLVASTTQTQGAGTIISSTYNELGTVANNDDAFTIGISAVPGEKIKMKNNGSNRAQVFPKSGDSFEGKSANISGFIGNGDGVDLECFSTGVWVIAGGMIYRSINVGDWDMDTTNQVTVAHGLNVNQIRGLDCIIRDDSNAGYYSFANRNGSTANNTSIESMDSTNITLFNYTASFFDNANFSATSYNRGFISVKYYL